MRTCLNCKSEYIAKGSEKGCSIRCRLLLSKDINESGCWIFKGSPKREYGKIRWNGKSWPAHRCSYQTFVAPIPEKMLVCHKCDVPKCINPEHLFLGTNKENMADCTKKKRTCKGANSHLYKFTNEQIKQMRRLSGLGFRPCRLMKIFNCSSAYVWLVLNNKIRGGLF